ncbi:MAG: hypothetical protein WC099_01900 [Candidatus Paceibacterota bacterium]
MNEKLGTLFEDVFGDPGNDLSDDQKFDRIQKTAYEIGDGALLSQLKEIRDFEEITLSSQEGMSFEDSLLFLPKTS